MLWHGAIPVFGQFSILTKEIIHHVPGLEGAHHRRLNGVQALRVGDATFEKRSRPRQSICWTRCSALWIGVASHPEAGVASDSWRLVNVDGECSGGVAAAEEEVVDAPNREDPHKSISAPGNTRGHRWLAAYWPSGTRSNPRFLLIDRWNTDRNRDLESTVSDTIC